MQRKEFLKATGIMSLSLFASGNSVFAAKDKNWKYLGQPCRNFNILATAVITDPVDGKEKFVLSNFAAGETGNIIFIDPQLIRQPADREPGHTNTPFLKFQAAPATILPHTLRRQQTSLSISRHPAPLLFCPQGGSA